MRKHAGGLVYSPSDLVRFLESPFASWLDRYHLEKPGAIVPDETTADQDLIFRTGAEHERSVLEEIRESHPDLVEISQEDPAAARAATLSAMAAKASAIYQAALASGEFAGFADFLILDPAGRYEVWDTKLARSPQPYYLIQLCCYAEMLASAAREPLAERCGIILGTRDRLEFRLEEFFHYFREVKRRFLAAQKGFTGNLTDRPEPDPRADHGRWTSHAEKFFQDTDHLVKVAGITTGQIRKLHLAGITTLTALARSAGTAVPRLSAGSLSNLVAQARLQRQTRQDRRSDPEAPPRYEVLPHAGANGEPVGLGTLPPEHPSDIFFDMEGYPIAIGGLEYLFGVCFRESADGPLLFKDWWAHDRAGEKLAFEGFVDWAFHRWKADPGLHIYHYAAYEVSAARRLSTRHDTRQDEVDELLRNGVFVDLYQVVRHGLRIGEESYSIKKVEHLYRAKRSTEVATAADSIVQYAQWMASGEPRDWKDSPILRSIRDYNEDDCRSTAELSRWLRKVGQENQVPTVTPLTTPTPDEPSALPPAVAARMATRESLRGSGDPVSAILADLIDFHRREEKPLWWQMFDRAAATPEALRDDPGCIAGLRATGVPKPEKQSLVQRYSFDPDQENKLSAGREAKVMFTHDLGTKYTLVSLDATQGHLELKIGRKALAGNPGGTFPERGSVIPYEFVSAEVIQTALAEVAARQLARNLPAPVTALLNRTAPSFDRREAGRAPLPPRMAPPNAGSAQGRGAVIQQPGESATDAAIRITAAMAGDCLVVQGPPGTGKTYTASQVITALLAAGKKVGVASNSHKAVVNLLAACGKASLAAGRALQGIKVGGGEDEQLHADHPALRYIGSAGDAKAAFADGVVGGTAWLFTRPEWEGILDFLFIDEAGQVSLANAVAMARCAGNLVLLGDQMQLEQPIKGSHPGEAGLSVLQYALLDASASLPDAPVFHAVVPPEYGLFLGESRRMHPDVCRFISESIYEGRLRSHADCARQRIAVPPGRASRITREAGIVFAGVAHEGNTQRSDEEIELVKAVYAELCGRPYTARDGTTKPLTLGDFLFIAPYNAQVRALEAALPPGARVGSVDRFQGQEAPVCILSLCSSFGEYGPRGLAFILDRNRLNVAISRAQCLAVVVADPRIAGTRPGSIEEMRLLNLFCKLANAENPIAQAAKRGDAGRPSHAL